MWKFVAVVLLLCGISMPAFAGPNLDAGYFYCDDCLMTGPTPDAETNVFIHSTVNQYVTDWQNPPLTGALMHVEICNDSVCVTWQYTASGNFLSTGVSKNDGSHKYKNDNSRGGGGAGGASGSGNPGGGGGYPDPVPGGSGSGTVTVGDPTGVGGGGGAGNCTRVDCTTRQN
jgi:hypothetical protein